MQVSLIGYGVGGDGVSLLWRYATFRTYQRAENVTQSLGNPSDSAPGTQHSAQCHPPVVFLFLAFSVSAVAELTDEQIDPSTTRPSTPGLCTISPLRPCGASAPD